MNHKKHLYYHGWIQRQAFDVETSSSNGRVLCSVIRECCFGSGSQRRRRRKKKRLRRRKNITRGKKRRDDYENDDHDEEDDDEDVDKSKWDNEKKRTMYIFVLPIAAAVQQKDP